MPTPVGPRKGFRPRDGRRMLDPDDKVWEDHTRIWSPTTSPRLRTRISVLAVFRLGKKGSLDNAFEGLPRVFWLEDKGHRTSRSVTKVEFSGWAPRDLPNTTSRLQGKIADPDLTPGRHNLRARLCFQPHPMLSQFSIATPQLLDELRINFAADALRFLVPTSSNARLSRLL